MSIAAIKAQHDIIDVAKKLGIQVDPKTGKALCPFHNDKNPSLQFSKEKQIATCFSGNCSAGTMDVITLVEKYLKVNNVEALKWLNPITNTIKTPSLLQKLEQGSRNAYSRSKQAQAYADFRGLEGNLWYLGAEFYKNWNEEEKKQGEAIGILKKYRLNLLSSAFKNRLVFFLRDKNNKPVSIYGRAIENNNTVPHLYLKEGQKGLFPAYPKPQTKQLILTESIIDAQSLLQHKESLKGYEFLALYGTNGLTKEITEAIKNLKQLEEIVFFFDGDKAGNTAIERYVEGFKKVVPQVKLSKVETPEGEDINSLMVGHENAGELFKHLLDERSSLYLSEPPKETPKQVLKSVPKQSILNTEDVEHIKWQKDNLCIEVWGGIDTHNLSRLRLSLHVYVKGGASFRDDVNLYNYKQKKQFLHGLNDELGMSLYELKPLLENFISEVENYRLAERAKREEKLNPAQVKMSDKDKQEALKLLRSKNLPHNVRKLLNKSGLIDESSNGLLLFTIYLTRFFKQPLHAIIFGSSGSGKTYLQSKVGACLPPEQVRTATSLSENTLYYSPKGYWNGVVLQIEDLTGVLKALYPMREIMSNQKIVKYTMSKSTSGKPNQHVLEVNTQVCISGCTTAESVYEDNSNRSFLMYVNTDKNHEKQVLNYIKSQQAGSISLSDELGAKNLLMNMQRLLVPIKVVNPYATQLDLPLGVRKRYRSLEQYLQLINAITFLNQYQRNKHTNEQTGEQYITTELEDIELANELCRDSMLRKSDPLTGGLREFYESLKFYLSSAKKEGFTAKDLLGETGLYPMKINRYLRGLEQRGYITVTGGNRKTGYEFKVVAWDEYDGIKQSINYLDELLQNLKKVSVTAV